MCTLESSQGMHCNNGIYPTADPAGEIWVDSLCGVFYICFHSEMMKIIMFRRRRGESLGPNLDGSFIRIFEDELFARGLRKVTFTHWV